MMKQAWPALPQTSNVESFATIFNPLMAGGNKKVTHT